ncbi:hypothetical protein Dimus_024194 [Dionaea muscipula]
MKQIQGLPPSPAQATPASEPKPVAHSLSPVLIIIIAPKTDLEFHRSGHSSECPGHSRAQSPSSRNRALVRARSPRRHTIGHNPIVRVGHRFLPYRRNGPIIDVAVAEWLSSWNLILLSAFQTLGPPSSSGPMAPSTDVSSTSSIPDSRVPDSTTTTTTAKDAVVASDITIEPSGNLWFHLFLPVSSSTTNFQITPHHCLLSRWGLSQSAAPTTSCSTPFHGDLLGISAQSSSLPATASLPSTGTRLVLGQPRRPPVHRW